MEAENEPRPLDGIEPNLENHKNASYLNDPDKEAPKRKASVNVDEIPTKRIKHDDHFREAPSEPPQRASSQSRRDSYGDSTGIDVDRRRHATQEEKKRGKRLFGGLLSTLSQTTGGTQQKRRMEIERRQQERIRKQSIEVDKLRDEKRMRIIEIRKGEQIIFDEEVMRNKHTKMLAMARYLRTKSQPHIVSCPEISIPLAFLVNDIKYYLPWKLTAEQEDTIDDQIRQTKASIEREVEALGARKGQQTNRDKRSPGPVETTVPSSEELIHGSQATNGSEHPLRTQETELQASHHHDHHDETADVIEEADEDMVIY
ncbi:hypothetical protein F53441_7959 [Fusarium austroafricanum]|uniref:Pinin/SDK/MemA protein domain-containing protein n=1 Tax=Fusarium austroafricanum TaxID=2364996 RepID=A0A8H4NUX3_9HYPO|nr:hypothetical protein F53441_7959 [Fusarium austroafricanum]